ncbi:MAG: hypothetical protein R3F60_21930 [bacterium]
MIPGLNTDVRYKGKTFHIQTEDSGFDNPVLITHVFLGGTILGSEKQSYQDALGREDLEGHVRDLMRAQHRAMYRALLDGRYDDLARRPTNTSGRRPEGPIPLAGRTPGMGIISAGRGTTTSLEPAATTQDGPLARPTVTPPSRRTAGLPPPIPRDRTEPLPSGDAVIEAAAAAAAQAATATSRLPFPTDLTGGHRLPDVLLAYLLEDPEEG